MLLVELAQLKVRAKGLSRHETDQCQVVKINAHHNFKNKDSYLIKLQSFFVVSFYGRET